MKITKNLYYSKMRDEAHKIDLYLPEGECRALLVYFHGGGFVEGSRELAVMRGFAEDVTARGIAVASAEYTAKKKRSSSNWDVVGSPGLGVRSPKSRPLSHFQVV